MPASRIPRTVSPSTKARLAPAIVKPTPYNPKTSRPQKKRRWLVEFERSRPFFNEPLMGWTADADPIAKLRLTFPTRGAAIAYAERQGVPYRVLDERVYDGDPCGRHETNSPALADRRNEPDAFDMRRAVGDPADTFADPGDVLSDPRFDLEQKRRILTAWEWDERRILDASDEGLVGKADPERLAAIRTALVTLERTETADHGTASAPDREEAVRSFARETHTDAFEMDERKEVIGFVRTPQQLENAVLRLRASGFSPERINVIGPRDMLSSWQREWKDVLESGERRTRERTDDALAILGDLAPISTARDLWATGGVLADILSGERAAAVTLDNLAQELRWHTDGYHAWLIGHAFRTGALAITVHLRADRDGPVAKEILRSVGTEDVERLALRVPSRR